MKSFHHALAALLATLVLVAYAPSVRADDDDPPGRVARINYLHGSVSFQPGGEQDWVSAVPNRPMTTGDRLWADDDSRAELHVGSTAVRLNQKTGISFLQLNDRVVQLQLSEGTIIVRLRHLDDDQTFEVDTPNLAFSLLRQGEYRIETDPDNNVTTVSVFRGQGEVTGGGRAYTVIADQSARFAGTDSLGYDIEDLPEFDDFDNWAVSRDRHEDHSASVRYVSPEITGYEDLDDYGEWHQEGGYGPVWRPREVPEGWAPYRQGHWAWIAPWGWTWVDEEPWGFAPFHYGRWAFVGGGWCWVPGPVVVHPVYAPALVAFVGGGGGFHFALSFGGGGGIGWFPLAPGEVFVPAYRVSPRYVNNVNITNTTVNVTKVTNVYNYYNSNNTTINNTKITNITYANQQTPGAVTAVSKETFVNARPVASNTVAVNAKEYSTAKVNNVAPIAPVRQSVVGAGTPLPAAPPAAVMNRQVVAKTMPAPPRPSFEQQQKVLQANPGRPLTTAQLQKLPAPIQPAAKPMAKAEPPTPAPMRPGANPPI